MIRKRAPTSPSSVADLITADGLGDVAGRARQLADLGSLLNRVLPPVIAAQVRLANVRDGKLVFLATSPAWATRLRYSQALLLEAARQLGLETREVVVKVAPGTPASSTGTPGPLPLSETAARHLALAKRLLE